MAKRFLILLAFLTTLTASYFVGVLSVVDLSIDEGTDEVTDEVFLEVMDELMSNHYSTPTNESLLEGAIEGMIASLDDPFTSYFDYEEAASYQQSFGESYVGIGVTVSFIDELIVVESVKDDGPADTAGIRVNDIIAEVDSISAIGKPFFETVGLIIGEEGTDVTIGIMRNGVDEIINLTMTRSVIDSATVSFDSFVRGEDLIGYIEVTTFGDETVGLFIDAINDLEAQGIDGLIIDLRNNGGGHLYTVINMLNQFLLDNDIPMFSTEYYNDGELLTEEYFSNRPILRDYDIVTVVNQNSASASEVFASSMQEHGDYAVVGVTTYGKGTMQTDVDITATIEDSLHITIGKWFTTDGNWVHYDGGTDGVIPDVVVEKTPVELAYKMFFIGDETEILFDTVDARVANIQLVLNVMGYTVRTDGYFDDTTKLAILDIQETNALTETGNIDSDTLIVINSALDLYQDNLLNDTQLEAAIDYLIND